MKLTLRQWRGAKELTQREMSERLNVHINTYQKWEENPGSIKITDAKHISEIFDVPLDEIDFTAGGTK